MTPPPAWKQYSTEQHQSWLHQAMQLATLALPHDVPVGALVLSPTGHVIGTGYNTREAHQSPTGHAELNAITQAARALATWRLEGCCLYVTLEPCPMCAEALKQARLSYLVYGTPDPLYGAAGTCTTGFPADLTLGPLLTAPCQAQLRDFFRAKRN